MGYINNKGQKVLQGDGSYGFEAIIDGKDIVVKNVRATFFGGDHDPIDNGETASGVNTKGHPDLVGCALPMSGFKVARTEGSPLPKIPWRTRVKVYNRANGKIIEVPLLDLGPAKPPYAHAALDLTIAAFQRLGGSSAEGSIQVDYRIIDASKYVK